MGTACFKTRKMRQNYPQKNQQFQMFQVLAVFYIICLINTIQSCSPPRSRFGEESIRQLSELGRSDKAEIIVLGTVVNMFPDKRVQSMLVDIAIHMVLKSKRRINKIIKVSGFENAGKNNRNTLFVHQVSTDCVTTEVNLYGTYVFFLRTNKYNDYSVDEINFQPAVTEIPCEAKLSKDFKRLIKKYRKVRNNKSQCNDFGSGEMDTSRKCLKHRNFTKLLNSFKYKLLPIRKHYCNIRKEAMEAKERRKQKRKNRKKSKSRSKTKELQMRDIINNKSKDNKKHNNNNKNNNGKNTRNKFDTDSINTNSLTNNEYNRNVINNNNDKSSSQTNIILVAKSQNYILLQNRDDHLHVKLKNCDYLTASEVDCCRHCRLYAITGV